ncbi:dTMP kinase [Vitiosangium sp. GDMCC 1.1324]|uniref:dTMP kinase n=1 Tax=Vitiosangium sp. (strain GDMCC 1.1324) TaxID=2138576 RepID=UPI000D389EE3|nr:dTMP kinase [Vitiosangium sp. GDMCC 1.1324]PTL84182.1 dTMP kinase [Vitiosangium sp. GDMCC 1.1324]
MLIVFEGIDGSGKTTLSNRVARELRRAGLRVRHVREDGKLASPVSEGLRRFTRNPLHLALTPMAELLLYSARETQLLEEVTRPALAEYEVVIADRFLYTAEVLARWGRGLPEHEVRPILDACSRGLQPDRVFLIDVDPAIARARRRISKLLTPPQGTPSRKGLAGVGLQSRLRAGYRALAAESPRRWCLIENSDVPLDALVALLVQEVLRLKNGESSASPPVRSRPVAPIRSLTEARVRFLARLDGWMKQEPQLAAWFLAGLEGPDIAERRRLLAGPCPELIAHGLSGLTDAEAWSLRGQLEEAAPVQVLGSLKDLAADTPEAWELRERWETRKHEAVADSLDGLDSERAWKMRERLYFSAAEHVVSSLARLGGERAWEERWRWLSDMGGEPALGLERVARIACRAIRGVDDAQAWDWRERAFEAAPDAVLRTLQGLDSERAWEMRERHVARAPRAVLGTLDGLDVPRAWALRESFGVQCEEALDSFVGMEGATAWKLRTALADTWPAATVKNLGPLATTSRGQALIERLLENHPQDFALLRQAARAASDTTQERRDASA